ncbi:hypothetical protein TorRG33x02_338950, partial [Trema orientale]
VEEELKRTKASKLAEPFDAKFEKPVAKNRKIFNNILTQYVRDSIMPTTLSWADMKKEDIKLIFQRLEVSNVNIDT